MPRREHEVVFTCEGTTLRTPISYTVDVDMLQPADAFSMAFPLDRRSWDAVPLDGEVQIVIDEVPVLNGFVDQLSDGGDGTFTVQGRDRSGRLVDESISGAGASVANKRLSEIALELVSPWYSSITFSNAADRAVRRGRGKKAAVGSEPAITAREALAATQRIEAGVTRWEALERVLRPLQLLAWSTADGRQLVLARPNYDQAPQFEFFETPAGSNVKRMTFAKSNVGRYAQIEVSGSGFPPGITPPPRVPTFAGEKVPRYVSRNRIGLAYDGPNSDGTGLDFIRQKRVFVVSEALNTTEAQIEADRILSRGRSKARTIDVTLPGHGRELAGAAQRTLYTVDIVATIIKDIEKAPGDDSPVELVDAPFYCTRVTYQGSRDDEQTTMSFVPLGTLLI